jgi:hypothetical protein
MFLPCLRSCGTFIAPRWTVVVDVWMAVPPCQRLFCKGQLAMGFFQKDIGSIFFFPTWARGCAFYSVKPATAGPVIARSGHPIAPGANRHVLIGPRNTPLEVRSLTQIAQFFSRDISARWGVAGLCARLVDSRNGSVIRVAVERDRG